MTISAPISLYAVNICNISQAIRLSRLRLLATFMCKWWLLNTLSQKCTNFEMVHVSNVFKIESIPTILSYTVSKLVHVLRHSVVLFILCLPNNYGLDARSWVQ